MFVLMTAQTKGILNRHGKQLTVDERDQAQQKREAERASECMSVPEAIPENLYGEPTREKKRSREVEEQCVSMSSEVQQPLPSKRECASAKVRGLACCTFCN